MASGTPSITLEAYVFRTIRNPWMLAAVCLVGTVMAPVLVGFEPLAGDPELMYQPIKTELKRSLAEGRLPFWSDRFGLGVPLVAESHAAAFYPPNWLFYRIWSVETAYSLTMWIHWVALAATMFAYARSLGITQAGSALASIAFTLCGFQAVHAVHEPFYHLMPYLPLCLLLGDRYATTGRPVWLSALALAWGTQVTLGHFQIQMWTAGLILVAGAWRTLGPTMVWRDGERRQVAQDGVLLANPASIPTSRNGAVGSRRRPWRILGLMLGLAWGAAISWVQLRLTRELTGVSGFDRPPQFLANYLFPPQHWAQFALPSVYLGRSLAVGEDYWLLHGTTAGEACAYVGVVPLILAFVGWVAAPRARHLAPWRVIVPLSLALATMPGWWPDGFAMLLNLPGLGWFRAPARYTLLTSLGLALLAGRGMDRSTAPRRFWGGLTLAIGVSVVAWVWSLHLAGKTDFRAGMGAATIGSRFLAAGLAWVLGLLAIIGWRLGRLGAWAPLTVSVLELSTLLFLGPSWWGWRVGLPESSPVLRHLAGLPAVGLVGGRLLNVPVDAGLTTAYPTLGITPPPPNYLLESAMRAPKEMREVDHRWQMRFGVTHGIWGAGDDVRGHKLLAVIPDPAIDRVMESNPQLRARGPWKLVEDPFAFPPAWICHRVREAKHWGQLYSNLSRADLRDEAWFLPEDLPPPLPEPSVRNAHVVGWDGHVAEVEHDGSCILILRRTYYPGWTYRINDGPSQPVFKVQGGLHGIPLAGAGTSRVVVQYRPTGLGRAATISLTALGISLLVIVAAGLKATRIPQGASTGWRLL